MDNNRCKKLCEDSGWVMKTIPTLGTTCGVSLLISNIIGSLNDDPPPCPSWMLLDDVRNYRARHCRGWLRSWLPQRAFWGMRPRRLGARPAGSKRVPCRFNAPPAVR
jgi:hypothetical protein